MISLTAKMVISSSELPKKVRLVDRAESQGTPKLEPEDWLVVMLCGGGRACMLVGSSRLSYDLIRSRLGFCKLV